MDSYADLSLGAYRVLSGESFVSSIAMTVFDESDKYYLTSDAIETVFFGYSARVDVVRDRLDAMGFTLSAARAFFTSAAKARVAELTKADWHSRSSEREIAVLSRVSFDAWLRAYSRLRAEGIQSWNRTPASINITREDPDLYDYMLDDDVAHYRGYPSGDFRFFLRAASEACDSDETLDYDLSDVLAAGYYSSDEPVADRARDKLLADFPVNAPIVVLTEGSSDRVALQSAMTVLMPHLRSYFSFFDFAAASARGGASALVESVKAFVAARIANRVVAVLDNDTAAEAALRALTNVKLPSNIQIVRLPNLNLAADYPTLGPSGPANLNVNGLAGSIELYFGRDVLTRADGSLTPVQWRGYESTLGRYQGELLNKRDLQDRFEVKVKAALTDVSKRATQDWDGMIAILTAIRTAFSESITDAG